MVGLVGVMLAAVVDTVDIGVDLIAMGIAGGRGLVALVMLFFLPAPANNLGLLGTRLLGGVLGAFDRALDSRVEDLIKCRGVPSEYAVGDLARGAYRVSCCESIYVSFEF
jgi:hypothetical protein